ncbi:MAG: hypothetical protein JWO31_3547 [Phycisphaerales bacterium]|nr:hypothetical protein [Phycisphaerales bacterium]
MPAEPPDGPPPAVSVRAVLAALAEVKRRGHWPLFQRLERAEPDLAEHVLESLSLVHRDLLAAGASPKVARRLQRRVQSVVLVAWLCLRPGVAGDGDESDPPTPQPPEVP